MPLSKCCGAEVLVATADEGTSFYLCGECRQACDTKPSFDPIAFAEWVKEREEKAGIVLNINKFDDGWRAGALETFDTILSYLASHGVTTKE